MKIKIRDLSLAYGGKPVFRVESLDLAEHRITAIVGPSGAGKSTFLMTLNRLWETIPGCEVSGRVSMYFDGRYRDVYHASYPVTTLRRRVGTVFQVPNPLPMSIYRNVAFPLVLSGKSDARAMRSLVEHCLRRVGLWDEVADRLDASALTLSGGQQQRLCIARALILDPEVLLLDEPTSSLDGNSVAAIESLLVELKARCTILVVSHYLDQVQRIADSIVEFRNGALVGKVFENPN